MIRTFSIIFGKCVYQKEQYCFQKKYSHRQNTFVSYINSILIVILLLYISWLTLVWFYISISCLSALSSIYGSQKWLVTKILMWSVDKLDSLMCVLILSKTLGTLKQNHCYTQLIYSLSRKNWKMFLLIEWQILMKWIPIIVIFRWYRYLKK